MPLARRVAAMMPAHCVPCPDILRPGSPVSVAPISMRERFLPAACDWWQRPLSIRAILILSRDLHLQLIETHRFAAQSGAVGSEQWLQVEFVHRVD